MKEFLFHIWKLGDTPLIGKTCIVLDVEKLKKSTVLFEVVPFREIRSALEVLLVKKQQSFSPFIVQKLSHQEAVSLRAVNLKQTVRDQRINRLEFHAVQDRDLF